MEPSLTEVVRGLSDCSVDVTRRPDGSVLLSVAQNGHRLSRVVDNSYTADEIVRMIKFDLLASMEGASLNEAVKHYSSDKLPTYANRPIRRTRSASLWALRKIKNL